MLASVVICTYNRSELLEAALRSVISQDFSVDRFEVVVVDNNSTDDTREIVAAISSGAAVKISYVFVEQQGLSYARNAGIEASSGEIVVFTDDDIEADRYWLTNLVDAFAQPDVCCAGGPLKPLWLHPRPEWLVDELLPAIAISDFPAVEPGSEFKSPNYPWGANIAFRKSVFESIGMFPTDMGRVGKRLLSNEEIFLCRRIEMSGRRIVFADKAIVYHKVPAFRLRKNYFLHRYSNQGASDAILDTAGAESSYRRLRQLLLSLKSNDAPKFAARCFLRSASAYLIQLGSLAQTGAVQLDAVRLIHSAMKTVADRSETHALHKELQDRTSWALELKEAVTARDETVRSLQATVEERTAWAQSVTKELDQRDATVQSLQQELTDRTAWARELAQTVAERDGTVRSLQTTLDERTRWALELRETVAAHEESVQSLQESLDERTAWARKLEEELAQKDCVVLAFQEETSKQTGWALTLQDEAEKLGATIKSLQQELDDRTAWALRLNTELEQTHLVVQSLQQKVTEQSDWANALKAELDRELMLHREKILEKARRLETEVASKDALNEQLLEKNGELQRLQKQWDAERTQLVQELSTKEVLVASLLNSMSWKITSPLRSLYSAFTKKS